MGKIFLPAHFLSLHDASFGVFMIAKSKSFSKPLKARTVLPILLFILRFFINTIIIVIVVIITITIITYLTTIIITSTFIIINIIVYYQ